MPPCHCARPDTAACPACRRASLERSLRLLPQVYRELEEQLVPQAATGTTRTLGSGRRLGIPLNGKAVDARRAVLGTLATWAEVVVEGRRLGKPRRTVPSLAAFLDRHAPWLAAHPAGQDATAELATLLASARRAAGAAARRISVGPCVVDGCGGGLTALLSQERTAPASSVDCDRDGTHSWPPQRWLELCGEERTAPGEQAGTAARPSPGLSSEQIARTWRISTGTVYWLASTHGWQRSRHGREVRYAHQDVLRSLGNR